MGYYSGTAGDYRTGGYAGDPGFLSGIWKVIKTVGKGILGIPAKGTIPAVVAGAAAGYGIAQPGIIPSFPGGAPPKYLPPGRALPGTGLRPAMGQCLPGPAGPTRGSVMPTNGCCPAGFHLEKAGRGYCVRNRRMNVTNPRALRRSISREKGFQRLASKVGYVKRKR